MCPFPSLFVQCKWANSAKEWPFCYVWLAVWSCCYSLWFYTCSRHNPKIFYFHEMLSVLSKDFTENGAWIHIILVVVLEHWDFPFTIRYSEKWLIMCNTVSSVSPNTITAIYMLNSLFKQKCKETCSSHWLLPKKLELQRSQIKHLQKTKQNKKHE